MRAVALACAVVWAAQAGCGATQASAKQRAAAAHAAAVAAAAGRPSFAAGDAAAESCALDLHLVLDVSGSMNDRNGACGARLAARNESFEAKRSCWAVNSGFARAAVELVNRVCATAGQRPPRVSVTFFSCPGTGKSFRALLEPNNNPASVEAALERVNKQWPAGYSCGSDALKRVSSYIAQTEKELEGSGTNKIPVVLMISDGHLQPRDAQWSISTMLGIREGHGAVVAAATPFVDAEGPGPLARFAPSRLVLDSLEPPQLERLGLSLGSVTAEQQDLPSCSAAALDCFQRRSALLAGPAGEACPSRELLYTALAQCGGAGCAGLDLTGAADECLRSACPAIDCSDIATHVNAQPPPFGGGDSSSNSSRGDGFDASARTPGLLAGARVFSGAVPLDAPLAQAWALGAGDRGDSSSPAGPVLLNDGAVLVVANAAPGAELRKVDAASGAQLWVAQLAGAGRAVLAQPVQLGAADGGDVLAGDTTGRLRRLAGADGTTVREWELGPGAITAAAAAPNGGRFALVAVAGAPGLAAPTLVKLRVDGAAPVAPGDAGWRRAVCDTEQAAAADAVVGGIALLRHGAVLVGCREGALEKYSFETGTRVFRTALGKARRLRAMPSLEPLLGQTAAVVAANATDAALLLFNLTTGLPLWDVPLPAGSALSPVWDARNASSLVVLTDAGDALRVDASNGRILLKRAAALPLGAGAGLGADAAQAADGTLVVPAAAQLVFLNPATLTQARAPVDFNAPLIGAPVLAKDGVLAATSASALVRAAAAPNGGRRVLATTSTWPQAAIIIIIVLVIVLIALSFWLFTLCR
jgi:outer membrane protein assembly factor BamB